MILGMSAADFTVLHVVISMVAIFSGFIVLGGMYSNARLGGWTAFFLATTLLTNITGFLFPIAGFTPAIGFGILSSLLLLVALFALYGQKLTGSWRTIYVVTALIALYLNVFVLIAQSFQKVAFLKIYAPTGGEPPFLIAQAVTLVVFVLLGWMALKKYHPLRLVM